MVLSLQGQINPPPLFIPAVTLLISLRASQPAPLKTPPQICYISLQALVKGSKGLGLVARALKARKLKSLGGRRQDCCPQTTGHAQIL